MVKLNYRPPNRPNRTASLKSRQGSSKKMSSVEIEKPVELEITVPVAVPTSSQAYDPVSSEPAEKLKSSNNEPKVDAETQTTSDTDSLISTISQLQMYDFSNTNIGNSSASAHIHTFTPLNIHSD